MYLYKNEKTAVFIDGANLYSTAKALEFDIDYKSLLRWIRENTRLIRANYYTALTDDDDDFCPLRPLIDWLDYNGYNVITKAAREFYDSKGNRKQTCDIEMELAVDMMDLSDHVDHIILFSGDGDYTYVVNKIQDKGVHVTVASTIETSPPMIADSLRRQSDHFTDILKIKDKISRK